MKKTNYYYVLFFSLLIFFACKKNNENVAKPTADFSISGEYKIGKSLLLNNTSQNYENAYFIIENIKYESNSFHHVFNSVGSKEIKLVASNKNGESTKTQIIEITDTISDFSIDLRITGKFLTDSDLNFQLIVPDSCTYTLTTNTEVTNNPYRQFIYQIPTAGNYTFRLRAERNNIVHEIVREITIVDTVSLILEKFPNTVTIPINSDVLVKANSNFGTQYFWDNSTIQGNSTYLLNSSLPTTKIIKCKACGENGLNCNTKSITIQYVGNPLPTDIIPGAYSGNYLKVIFLAGQTTYINGDTTLQIGTYPYGLIQNGENYFYDGIVNNKHKFVNELLQGYHGFSNIYINTYNDSLYYYYSSGGLGGSTSIKISTKRD